MLVGTLAVCLTITARRVSLLEKAVGPVPFSERLQNLEEHHMALSETVATMRAEDKAQ